MKGCEVVYEIIDGHSGKKIGEFVCGRVPILVRETTPICLEHEQKIKSGKVRIE